MFSVLTDVVLTFLYVAIAIAILKYRLYDIDVVIGKTMRTRAARSSASRRPAA